MIRHLSGLAAIVMMAAWALPASAQAPRPGLTKAPGKAGAVVRDRRGGMRVLVTMEQLQCLKTTEGGNKADDISLVVAGKSARSLQRRLPRAGDTFVFKTGQTAGSTGWKTKAGKDANRPVLFAGSLLPGESVCVTVMVAEQDKPSGVVGKVKKAGGLLGKIKGAAKKVGGAAKKVGGVAKKAGGLLGKIPGAGTVKKVAGKVKGAATKIGGKVAGAAKKVKGVLSKLSGEFDKVKGVAEGLLGRDNKALNTLNNAINKARQALKAGGDDLIGGVTVVVKNDNGKLQVKYLAGAQTKDSGAAANLGANGRSFEMTGAKARYKAMLNVK